MNLHSQLVDAIDNALSHVQFDNFDSWLFVDERWSAILQFISHLRKQTQQQDVFLAQLEQKLQGTLGYSQLPPEKKTFLRENIRRYASTITLADAKMSDETGFSSVSVRQMIRRLGWLPIFLLKTGIKTSCFLNKIRVCKTSLE